MHHTPFKSLKFSFSLVAFLFLLSCSPAEKPFSKEFLKADAKFRSQLAKGRDHYLKLIGLHPLIEGTNIFGASSDNNIQLNSIGIPATIGAIEYLGDSLWFTAADTLDVKTVAGDSLISQWAYEFETSLNSPMLKYEHLEWQVIKRAEEYFLRVKDQNSALAKEFKGFEAYPLQQKYLVEAKYEPFDQPNTIDINTQLGTSQQMNLLGTLRFELDDQELSLDVGEGGFLIVGDMTNDETTYGGGRYVYVDLPDEAGNVTIDFNRLYNPPCVYSEFTTCPLPPVQNVLQIAIAAGEKYTRL